MQSRNTHFTKGVAPLFAVLVPLLFIGNALAGPTQDYEDQSPEEPTPESCTTRLVVWATSTTVLSERRLCLTSSDIEAGADLHDEQTWLASVPALDACTILSWQIGNSTQWFAAPCHDDSTYGDEPAIDACTALQLSDPARLDLCQQPARAEPKRLGYVQGLKSIFGRDAPGPCDEGGSSEIDTSKDEDEGNKFINDPCRDAEKLERTFQELESCFNDPDCAYFDNLPIEDEIQRCLSETGTGQVCGTSVPNLCPGGADLASPCGITNPCPQPVNTGGENEVEICGRSVPNPCPNPIGSSPGALVVVCGVTVPNPCSDGVDVASPCGIPNPCPNPTGSSPGALIVICGIPIFNPCPSGVETPGGSTLARVCGFQVPNPCPSPTGSAPGALIVICGIPIFNPCPEGVDTSQACGRGLPDPQPTIDLVLALVAFAINTASGCVSGAIAESGDVPAGPEDTLGCGATVRLALDTADIVITLAWEAVAIAEAVAADCLSAFGSEDPPSSPSPLQIGCGQLLRELLDQNPCKDLLDPQELSTDDPIVCGQTIPVSEAEALVQDVAECLGTDAPVGDSDGGAVDGLQATCDEARAPKTIPLMVPCNERDADGDGIPVMDACTQSVTVDPSGDEDPTWSEPSPTLEGVGDPDDSDPTTPIPSIQFHTDLEPSCGGAYELGATVTLGGSPAVSPLTGTLPCPLPYTTPAYPFAASQGEGVRDNDRDGIPGYIVLQQRQTTIHADGSVTHEDHQTSSVGVDPDDDDEDAPLGGRNVRFDPVQDDADGDGIGDEFQREWEERVGGALDWLDDFDQDGLSNVDEFRWDLIPICVPTQFENCMDWEKDRRDGSGGDNWRDGEEVPYWNDPSNDAHIASLSEDGIALLEPDRHHDVDGDQLPDTRDPDADDDNLLDGDEVKQYGTYPEFQDSDCAATATVCTLSHQSSGFYDTDREGAPGTGDGINDDQEIQAWTNLAGATWSGDADGDGILNLMDADSDDDGLDDGPEFLEGRGQVFPNNEDSDNDGVLDGLEALWNVDSDADGWINAGDPDSDNDGMPDGYEVTYGFDPLDPADGLQDADLDGLNNVGEYSYGLPAWWNVRSHGVYWGGTDPLDPDTDDDELLDGPEVLEEGTDPFWWDTDGDGLPDAWEAEYKLLDGQVVAHPLIADAFVDGDADSFDVAWCRDSRGRDYHNLHEYEYGMPNGWDSRPASLGGDGVYWDGTHPNNPNTDGDLLIDGYEVCTDSTDPNQAEVTQNGDEDLDGLLTLDEVEHLTDFQDWDTDGDGLCDGGAQAANCVLASGSRGDGEVHGWTILVAGETRLVTSNPLTLDTDGDLLGDLEERMLGTNPRDADTDGDGVVDGEEDTNRNGVRDGGELDALNVDSDADGLLDGQERHVYFTDGLDWDTDFDGISDAAEVQTHGTDPLNHDSDGDLLGDGEELGVATGGTAVAPTSPLNGDSDGDGLLDGAEILHYALDPLDADEDCDGLIDGTDANPYASNVPPGTVRSAADQAACRPAGLPSTAWDHTVGWVDFNENDGVITVLGAYPPSENAVVYAEVLMVLSGTIRTSTSGATQSSTATLRAELRPLEEPAGAGAAVYTHGVRLALPQGMVEATSAEFSLTYIDENLNAASYEGSASAFVLNERLYQNEGSAGGTNRPGCEHFWWESDATGEAASEQTLMPASQPGILDSLSGLGPELPDSLEGHTIVKLVQPAAPSLTGQLVDGTLFFSDFSGSVGQFVVYQNASITPSAEELELYRQMGWGGTSFSLSRMGQAVSSAWATADFVTSAGSVVGRAWTATGEELVEAKDATVAFYHTFREECNHPLTWSANLILDVAFVSDIESIYYGATEDDTGELAMGVVGIALTVVPVSKIAGMAKVGLRAGDTAGDAYDVVRKGERFLRPMATMSTDIANAGGDALKEAKFVKQSVLFDFAKKDPVHAQGLTRIAGVENTAEVGRELVDNRLLIDFAGRLPGADETAEAFLRGLDDGPIDALKLAEAQAKVQRVSPGDEHVFREAVARFNAHAGAGADNGIVGIVGKAAGRTGDYHAAGHAFQVMHAHEVANVAGRVVVKNGDTATEFVLDASKTSFKHSATVATSKGPRQVNVDNYYETVPGSNGKVKILLQEAKHYTGGKAAGYKGGEVPLNEFNKLQVEKYVALRDQILDLRVDVEDVAIQYVIKGRASPELRAVLMNNNIDLVEIPF